MVICFPAQAGPLSYPGGPPDADGGKGFVATAIAYARQRGGRRVKYWVNSFPGKGQKRLDRANGGRYIPPPEAQVKVFIGLVLHQSRRQFYEETSTHLGVYCRKLGLTPNFLTGVSLLCALVCGLLFWQKQLIWALAFMALTSLTDMLDGATARAANMGTVFGGILDHVSDRYGEFFILAGIGLSGLAHHGWAIFALFGMLIASYTRAAAESIGNLPSCAVGIMGRLEKFIIIVAGALLEYFFPHHNFLDYCLIVVGTASIITSIQRLVFAARELKKRQ